MNRLCQVLIIVVVVVVCGGCYRVPPPAVPWKPHTVVPPMPAFCPDNWQWGDQNIDHPGYYLSWDQQSSCDRHAMRRDNALQDLKEEIREHQIDLANRRSDEIIRANSAGAAAWKVLNPPSTIIVAPSTGGVTSPW